MTRPRADASTASYDRFAGLHVLADDDPRWPVDPVAQGEAACRGGAHVVQLRAKHATDRDALAWARRLRAITREHGALLVVNDRFDLALAAGADAVHLGQTDLPPARVAAAAGQGLAIGRSTHTLEQAEKTRDEPVDYVACGPVYGTASKESEYSPRGMEMLREVVSLVAPRPVVAIGGITASNLPAVIEAGARGAAVISAVAAASDPVEATRALVRCFEDVPGWARGGRMSDLGPRVVSAAGLLLMIAIAWAASTDRRRIPWSTVAWGVGIQLVLAVVLLKTPAGQLFFVGVSLLVDKLLAYTEAGTRFMFGPLLDTGFSFVLGVLPIIVFMGSLFAILYHLGWVQVVVRGLAWALSRVMGLSGAESLAAVANIFVGMVESVLIVKPYVERMTRSELFSTMTVGMATVAGSVLIAYVQMLGGGAFAGHLVTASLMSAPAGLLLAKMIVPESGAPQTRSGADATVERDTVNVIDAAAEGAINGLRLAAYVGAMLVAFVALIAGANDVLGALGAAIGLPGLSLQSVLGTLLAPLAFMMGVPWADAVDVGALLGVKTMLNEFIAYQQLGAHVAAGELSDRSRIIASYALCGFANFGSLAILLGGLGGIAPSRRHEVAGLGLRSILSGSLATFMTACVVGMLI